MKARFRCAFAEFACLFRASSLIYICIRSTGAFSLAGVINLSRLERVSIDGGLKKLRGRPAFESIAEALSAIRLLSSRCSDKRLRAVDSSRFIESLYIRPNSLLDRMVSDALILVDLARSDAALEDR